MLPAAPERTRQIDALLGRERPVFVAIGAIGLDLRTGSQQQRQLLRNVARLRAIVTAFRALGREWNGIVLHAAHYSGVGVDSTGPINKQQPEGRPACVAGPTSS